MSGEASISADPSMDMFSLGILAWEVMTGKRFFGGTLADCWERGGAWDARPRVQLSTKVNGHASLSRMRTHPPSFPPATL